MSANLATPRPSRPSTPTKPALAVDTHHSKAAQSLPSPPTTSLTSALMSDRSAPSNPTLAVTESFTAMKNVTNAIARILDALGEQTAGAAELGPVLEINNQINLIRSQLHTQFSIQETRMVDVKARIRESVREHTEKVLRPQVHFMIKDRVEEKVKQRVREQLLEQIPDNLRQEIFEHKHQILQVQTNLHNSEARRYNALLESSTAFQEPLRPLIRPRPGDSASPMSPMNLASPSSQLQTPATSPFIPRAPAPTPTVLMSSTIPLPDLEPPTPSPLFPRRLADLFKLSPEATRTLALEYGLIHPESDSSASSPADTTSPVTPIDADLIDTNRDKNLNRFMAHIGVPFQIVLGSSSPLSPSPLITRISK